MEVNQNTNSVSTFKTSKYYKVILTIASLVVIGLVAMAIYSAAGEYQELQPDASMSQAVFLNNGEVYFGNITTLDEDYLVLEDIYYLQVTPALQQQADGTTVQDPNQQPQVNLIKLGEELHGPEDKMVVPVSSIIYWENIRNDGQVATAIAEAKANPDNAEAAPAVDANVAPQAVPLVAPQPAETVEVTEE